MTDPDSQLWQQTWQFELQPIFDCKIFSQPIALSDDHNAIKAKIVWDIKYVEDGSIARYKACLVARGFTQVHEIDYKETFAPIICYNALRILFAIAVKKN